MDGVSFSSECTDERMSKNTFYCCYDYDTMVNNVLPIMVQRKNIFCAINFPGSWADGSLMARFLQHIINLIGTYNICVDQGFPCSGKASRILVGPVPEPCNTS